MSIAAVVGLAVLVSGGPARAQAPRAQPEVVRALSVQYADGWKTTTPIGSTGRVSWTPRFPRIAGADTSTDGLPLNALQFEEAIDGQAVVVTIALLYGSPQQKRVAIATVRVTGDRPVRVDELQASGVQPIVLSIVELAPAQLHIPSTTTPSSQLEIGVETVSGAAPSYHAVIANHSQLAVMMLAFKAYSGDTIAVSGQPRGTGHLPLIPAGDSYVLKVAATANSRGGPGSNPWLPLDRLEITSVLWSDGLVEGDPIPAADERVLDAGTAQQLARLLTVLRTAARAPADHPLPQLRDAIQSLSLTVTSEEAETALAAIPDPARLPEGHVRSMMEAGMRNARSAVLNDVEEYARSVSHPQPSAYAEWLVRLIAKYDGWRTRIAG